MKTSLIILGIIVALIALIVLIGAFLPVRHTVSRSRRIQAPPEQVWAAIMAVEDFSTWRDVKRVEVLPSRSGGHRVWRETDRHGNVITFEAVEETAPMRLVTRIDPGLPFGGSWTWELAPAAGGATDVTITENGEIYNPLFRFMARFIFGYTSTMDGVLSALDKTKPHPRRGGV
jgi:uncharacterized protein YndB with AHSA1/START domain